MESIGENCKRCKIYTIREKNWVYSIPFAKRQENWNGNLLFCGEGGCDKLIEKGGTIESALAALKKYRKSDQQLFLIIDAFLLYRPLCDDNKQKYVKSVYVKDVFSKLKHPNIYFKALIKRIINFEHPCECVTFDRRNQAKVEHRIRIYSQSKIPTLEEISYRTIHHDPKIVLKEEMRPKRFWKRMEGQYEFFRKKNENENKSIRGYGYGCFYKGFLSSNSSSDSDCDNNVYDEMVRQLKNCISKNPDKSDSESEEFTDSEDERIFKKEFEKICGFCYNV